MRRAVCAVVLAACWSSAAPPPAQPVDEDLATAEAVLDGAVAAQGGRARLGSIGASRQTGTLITKKGLRGKLTILAAPPRSVLTTIDVAGLGVIRQGVSGDVVWEVALGKARVLAGAERAHQLREATADADVDWRHTFASATLRGVVDREGRRAYAVVLVTPEGDQLTRFYARDSLLLVGEDYVFASQLQTIPISSQYSDFRTVGGVKFPFHLVRTEGDDVMVIEMSSIELGVTVPPDAFALPAEVAALAP